MSLSKTSKLLQYINYRMRVTIHDGRQIVGRFMAFDRHMNLVLGDAEEFRKMPPKKGATEKDDKEDRRVLGLILLRGEEVVSITIEGPPPDDSMALSKQQQAPAGPGMGRAAGRGVAPVAAGAPQGLAGQARGVGGPAPGMMMPRPSVQGAPQVRPPGQSMPPPGGPPMRPGMPPPGAGPPGMAPPGMPPPLGGPPRPMGGPGMPPGGMPPPGAPPRPGMPPP